MLVLGIEDTQIWLAYVFCVLSALGCMVYGALNWRGGEEEQVVKSGTQRTAVQDQ
ncbi:symporter small accessory protein [Methanosarcina sp. T3]|uniref:symporter small accessory protein n=1 Tax=Methanosarcina sp. T3 TaxID=3439062 RepID=UPI003F838A1A